mmetsp:Transcript_26659/g.34627  ORF Transcript_26659/g.34627 Transcript_26659/m.34627 type:complete len:357 (-) Transcript_26659:302-1372(-)
MEQQNCQQRRQGTCNICFDDDASLIESLHSNPCGGTFKCCELCAFTYLAHKINEKDVSSVSLTCPLGCKVPLTSNYVHKIIEGVQNPQLKTQQTKLLLKYDEAIKDQEKLEEERNRRLRRRLPSIKETATDIALSCWSLSKDTRRCPGCRNLIEKNGGCQHMTCRSCKHKFWWCCGRDVSKSHSEVLCLPIVYMNHQSKYWGPNILVRTVTKTSVAGVGVGLGCVAGGVAVVAVPTYVIGKTIDKKGGFADRRYKRRQARIAEQRRIRQERMNEQREARRQERIKNGEDPDSPMERFYANRKLGFNRPRVLLNPASQVPFRFRQKFRPVMNELVEHANETAFERELERSLMQPVLQ